MRAFLSASTYDSIGKVELDYLPGSSSLGATERRVNRVKTLDGGIAINDFGSSQGDRTIHLVWKSVDNADTIVSYLVEFHEQVVLSCRDGVFLCAPQKMENNGNEARLTLLVLERQTS